LGNEERCRRQVRVRLLERFSQALPGQWD